MSSSLKIAAVFATMNRSQTTLACVRALAAQTRPPDLVVVADNVSSDHTVAALGAMADLPFPLKVIEMPDNRGNAGGVQVAMDHAFGQGMDAVWILDDDSWPQIGSLEAMLEGPWDPHVVLHPLQIDPQTGKFTWPLQIADGRGGWKLVWSERDLPEGSRTRSRICWTGALLPKEVRDVVGPVNGELFIRGEDEDYPWRIEQAGFTQQAVRGAVLDHPGPQGVIHWKFLGKSFFFERGLPDWKLYYKVRNMVWLKRRHASNLRALAIALTYGGAAVCIDGPKRLALIAAAIRDGWSGRLGRWCQHP